jgi:hypothetical protein
VHLWKDGNLVPHSAGQETLLSADSATICIPHTKNGTKEAAVHHDVIGGLICIVAALARRIANIQKGSNKTQICWVCHPLGANSRVTDQDIGRVIRWGAMFDCLLTRGYTLN